MTSKVRKYFDKIGLVRDRSLMSCPILKYEQHVRQEAVIKMLDLKKGDKILDVGCGNARDLLLFAEIGAECVGADLSKGMLMESRKKVYQRNLRDIYLVLCDGTNLPFRSEILDKVSCSEVVEHIPDYEKCIGEMARVLVRGGRLAITTPNKNSLYGLVKKIGVSILGIKRKHPHDEWKTQKEVITIFSNCKIRVDKKLGICFVPSQILYRLPQKAKRFIVRVVFFFERRLRYKMNKIGYCIGLSGRKLMIHDGT